MTQNLSRADDLEDLFENGPLAIHLVGADGTILRANRAELDMLGYSPQEYIGHNICDFHADDETIKDILDRLSCRQKLDWYPARLRAKDGSIRHVEITSSVRFDGPDFINTRCFTRDVTDLRRAQAQVRQKEEYLETILDALPAAVYTTDAEGKVTYFNDAAVKLAGHVPELNKAQWCVTWRLRNLDGTPLPHSECPMAIALKERRPVRNMIAYAERPDGTLVPFQPFPTPLFGDDGELAGGINMLVDVSDQMKREEQIKFVMHELSHRSKNLLAVVMAVSNRTIKTSANLDDFEGKFTRRLEAMARSHDLLVENSWSGADIRDIVQLEITRFLGKGQSQRARISGQSIVLKPAIAQSLSLAVHELTTNALKHGAFSRADGDVEIEWHEKDGNAISFVWREHATLDAAPSNKKGFGTLVLSNLFREPSMQITEGGMQFSGVLEHARPDSAV